MGARAMREPPVPVDANANSQAEISREIAKAHAAYQRAREGGGERRLNSSLDFAPYRSSILRHPTKPFRRVEPEAIELSAPVFGHEDVSPDEHDLTIGHGGEP